MADRAGNESHNHKGESNAAPVTVDMPLDIGNIALTTIATIGTVLMLQYMQAVLIPIVLGILLAYTLEPFVRALGRAAIPRTISAGIVLVLLVGAIGLGMNTLAGRVDEMLKQIDALNL